MRRQFVHLAELFESHCLFSKKVVIALRQSRISLDKSASVTRVYLKMIISSI